MTSSASEPAARAPRGRRSTPARARRGVHVSPRAGEVLRRRAPDAGRAAGDEDGEIGDVAQPVASASARSSICLTPWSSCSAWARPSARALTPGFAGARRSRPCRAAGRRRRSPPERGQVDAAAHRARVRPPLQRLDHLGLRLEHLVAQRVRERLAREPDQAEPVEVVEVGGHAVDVAAAGLGADHRQARARRAREPTRAGPAAHVDRRLRALDREQAQDPRLVGRELVEDARVGRVRVLVVGRRRPSGAAARAPRSRSAVGGVLAVGARGGRSGRRPSDRRSRACRARSRGRRRRVAEQLGRRLAGRRRASDARAARSDAPTVHSAGPHHDAARCARARAARASARRASVGCSSSAHRSDSEDRQVEQAGAEAEHGAVQQQQPLVLAASPSAASREVGGRAARASARRSARGSARALAAVELGVGERRHRVVDRLRRRPSRGSRRTRACPTATRTAGRARPDGAVDGRAQRGLDHLARAVRARAVQQLVADVAERDDVVGDDLARRRRRPRAGGAGTGPWSVKRPDPAAARPARRSSTSPSQLVT